MAEENEVENDYNPIADLVQHSLDQDYNNASKVFNDIMTVKLNDVMDQEQIKLANQIYNDTPEDEDIANDEEESDLDDEQDSEDETVDDVNNDLDDESEEESDDEEWDGEDHIENDAIDLESMTKRELEELGREHGIELDRRKNKSDLIEELKEVL